MKRASVFLSSLLVAVCSVVVFAQGAKPAPGRLIEIEGNDQMKFSVTAIAAKPGEQLTVRLKSVGAMPKVAMAHNFVLLAAGTNVTEFANQSASAGPAASYIAPALKDKVLAFTALAGAGETVEVTFKAPTAPGAYTFLCSFPGHFAIGMRGTLTVK